MARFLRNAASLRNSLLPKFQEFRSGLLETSNQLCNYSTKGKKKSKLEASDCAEGSMSEKDLALKRAINQITSSFGKESIMWLGRSVSVSSRNTPVVSTGSFSLDLALGVGGLPKGRVVEIYGPEATGKTTLSLHVIAEAQKQGGYCVFVDAEHALDPAFARAIGVNTEKLLLSQPDCVEQALSMVDTLIRSGSVDVIVVDSVAALVLKGEPDDEMGHAHMAMQARLMSQALRKLTHSLSVSQTILIFINQVQAKLTTSGFGGPSEVTCGGNALKFYASIRLNVRRIGMVKKGEEVVGSQVVVKIAKNKLAPPCENAEIEIEFGKGCKEAELIDLGCKHKFITKSGSFFKMNGQNYHGRGALKKYLSENKSASDKLEEKVRHELFNVNETEFVAASDSTDEEAVAAA